MKKIHALRANQSKAKQSQFEPKPMLRWASLWGLGEPDLDTWLKHYNEERVYGGGIARDEDVAAAALKTGRAGCAVRWAAMASSSNRMFRQEMAAVGSEVSSRRQEATVVGPETENFLMALKKMLRNHVSVYRG